MSTSKRCASSASMRANALRSRIRRTASAAPKRPGSRSSPRQPGTRLPNRCRRRSSRCRTLVIRSCRCPKARRAHRTSTSRAFARGTTWPLHTSLRGGPHASDRQDHLHRVPDRGAPQPSRSTRRSQRRAAFGRDRVQGDLARGRAREPGGSAWQCRSEQRARRAPEEARCHRERDLHQAQREPRLCRRHGLRGDRRAVPAARAIRARQVPVAVRSARRFVEHRRQRRRSARSSRSCARRMPSADPAARRLPAARRAAGRGRLRDLRTLDDARAHDRQRRARLHARSAARRVHPVASQPLRAGRDAGVRDQRIEQPFLGIPGAALRRRMPQGLQRRSRQGFQHALDRLAGRRGAPHPHARRRLHVSARHARSPASTAACASVRMQSDRAPDRAGRRARQHGLQAHARRAPRAALHQKIGFVFGSRSEVERIERYHREGDMRDSEQPLFAARGLFRTPA